MSFKTSSLKRIGCSLSSPFSLDYRSLAFFRISISCVLLVDLYMRAQDLTIYYTDLGVLPRRELIDCFLQKKLFTSIHLAIGSTCGQAALFIIAGIFGLGMLLGIRTRLCTILSWMLLASLHTRNPYIIHGGDVLLKMMIFWSIFTPTAKVWSIDSLHKPAGKVRDTSIALSSVGTFALWLQLCLVYIIDVKLKTSPIWTKDYTALYYALNIDQMVTPIGLQLSQHLFLCKALSLTTLLIQKYGILLLCIPFFTSYCRIIAILIFCSFHIGSSLTLEIGLFAHICIASWLLFVPSIMWNRIEQLSSFVTLQTSIKRILSVIKINPPSSLKASTPATQFITKASFSLLPFILLIYVVLWNIRTLDFERYQKLLPPSQNWLGYLLRLDQHWTMFAPFPLRNDGWYVIPATKVDGSKIDLFNDGNKLSWDKPTFVSKAYKNVRWQKYMMHLNLKKIPNHISYYAHYLTRQWNSTHEGDQQIKSFQIIFMREKTPPPNKPYKPPVKDILWTHRCL